MEKRSPELFHWQMARYRAALELVQAEDRLLIMTRAGRVNPADRENVSAAVRRWEAYK